MPSVSSYEFKLEKFSGPLDKLLELIEERKLEITEISLAEVTGDFLKYVKTLENVDTPFITDFIVVASRLILIKSKSLLPDLALTEEEAGEIKDLERRLSLYKELKPARKTIQDLWRGNNKSFGRTYLLTRTAAISQGGESARIFYPGKTLGVAMLTDSLTKLFADFRKFALETETIKREILSLEEKIQEIVGRLKDIRKTSFKALAGSDSRAELIVIFLAILHLAREQLISLEQEHHSSDIMIEKRTA